MVDAPTVAEKKVIESEAKKEVELLDVKLEAPDTTVHGEKPKSADEQKRDVKKEAPITTVAQLRDKGIQEGISPSSAQVTEMREIEEKAYAKLGEEHRPPASER